MHQAPAAIVLNPGGNGQHQWHQHRRGHAVQAHGQSGERSGCGVELDGACRANRMGRKSDGKALNRWILETQDGVVA